MLGVDDHGSLKRSEVALRCRCGTPFRTSAHDLIFGRRTSCGCLKKEKPGRTSATTYGAARAAAAQYGLELLGTFPDEEPVRDVSRPGAYRLRCRCGTVFGEKTRLIGVVRGTTVSCGCAARKVHEHAELAGSRRRPRPGAWRATPAKLERALRECGAVPVTPCLEAVPATSTIDLICRCGRPYQATAYHLISGGVRSCGCLKSHAQNTLFDFVKTLAPDAVPNTRKVIPPLEVDIWIPSHRLAIEYNGLYWHGEVRLGSRAPSDCARKHDRTEAAGARLLTFFEDEWVYRRAAVEGYLRAVLGTKRTVGARKCEVVWGQGSDFVEAFHIQGAARASTVALKHDGEIVAAAQFAAATGQRKGPGRSYELVRYCVGPEVSVAGGLSKLLGAWSSRHPCDSFVTYSDRRISSGRLYRSAGFVNNGDSPPRYWYFFRGGVREHRFKYRKHALERLGWLQPGDTEWDAMRRQGYDRVWDAGKTRWVLEF